MGLRKLFNDMLSAVIPPARQVVAHGVKAAADRFEEVAHPQAKAPHHYGAPIAPSQLPPPGRGLRLVTLNIANGAGDAYRTAEARSQQAAWLEQTEPGVVALQEVDVGVKRTDDRNTALDVVARMNPAMRACFHTDHRHRTADGTTRFDSGAGTLVTGASFYGDERSICGREVDPTEADRGAAASYGNATYVAPPNRVEDAYTVSLPRTDAALSESEERGLASLGKGAFSDEERALLAAANEAQRAGAGDEPRSALVTRVVDGSGHRTSIINVHLSHDVAIRGRQLEAIAAIARSEGRGPPAREVVVMGDFNATREEVAPYLESAGLRRTVGSPRAPEGESNFGALDQIYVSATVETEASAQLQTDGASDHPNGGTTTIQR